MNTMTYNIQMVDLIKQYENIAEEIDHAVLSTIRSGEYINGSSVKKLASELAAYTGAEYVIPCANGTDALQVALMSLNLPKGSEVIVPAFTYVATAEVIALLGFTPVLCDVEYDSCNINISNLKAAVTERTKVIVPVHLFGQCTDMEAIMELAAEHSLYVIEDCAQAIGSVFTFSNGQKKQAGTIGHIGCTSFFPSKNLGCYGDGGAIFTNDSELADSIRMICNHGQKKKYYHDVLGVNSRLDTIQAAVLSVKLKYLNQYIENRNRAATMYDAALRDLNEVEIPVRDPASTHVFHQYTIKVAENLRNELKEYLLQKGIPSMIYYPLALHQQKAYQSEKYAQGDLPVSETLCLKVLSLPMHTEMDESMISHVVDNIKDFFKQ